MRVTTSRPSTGTRFSSFTAGTNQAVWRSAGWAATAKPNTEGFTSVISAKVSAPSSLLKMPLWC